MSATTSSTSPPRMELLFSRTAIAARVAELAAAIDRDYNGKKLLLVGILKGSLPFTADLARALQTPAHIDFVRIASYGSGARSSGIVEIRNDLELPVRDRHVLIVEDIVDSGCTLETLCNLLLLRQPASLRVCSLIDKRARRVTGVTVDYTGFTLEDGFVVGYGLDYDEHYRGLPDLYLLHHGT